MIRDSQKAEMAAATEDGGWRMEEYARKPRARDGRHGIYGRRYRIKEAASAASDNSRLRLMSG